MSGFKHGDVAMVTALNQKTPYRAYYDGPNGWREYGDRASGLMSPGSVRPLVVLDPEDAEQVQRLYSALACENPHAVVVGFVSLRAALRVFANPEPAPVVTDAEARAMRKALARLARQEGVNP